MIIPREISKRIIELIEVGAAWNVKKNHVEWVNGKKIPHSTRGRDAGIGET